MQYNIVSGINSKQAFVLKNSLWTLEDKKNAVRQQGGLF